MLATRRSILKAFGIGAAGLILEEPIRKMWFVPSNAPVGSRIEQPACRGPVFTSFDKAFETAARYEGEPVWRIEDIQATSNFAMDPDLEFTEEENAEIRRLATIQDAIFTDRVGQQLRQMLEAAVKTYQQETLGPMKLKVSLINDLEFPVYYKARS
jgi:hypothetical protein